MSDTSIIVKKELQDGSWICIRKMLFGNVRLSLVEGDPDEIDCFHSQNYCFHDPVLALVAFEIWDGEGDPPSGWVRHIETGRRYDPVTGKSWIAP